MAHVLLIDDDDELRGLLCDALVRAGHDVSDGADGNSGLALFRQRPADAVVTDIVMADGDGIETVQAIRRLDGEVPIVAVSGNAMYLRFAGKLGATGTLLKPFRASRLIRLLEAEWAKRAGTGAADDKEDGDATGGPHR